MKIEYRKKNFKIAQLHGKHLDSKSPSREASLRNSLYHAGILCIPKSSNEFKKIRLVGYEVPILEAKTGSRVECIDLLGYDQDHMPWIIELKKGKANDSLDSVVAQINRYAKVFEEGVRSPIQDEIRERFLWTDFCFSEGLGKMILAHQEFFKDRKKGDTLEDLKATRNDITFASFAGGKKEASIISNLSDEIPLKIER